MNPTGVLFALAMMFTVACHSATTTTGDMVTPEILAAIEREALIVDVRTPEEFADGHYPGAINIPHESILDGLNQLGVTIDTSVILTAAAATDQVKPNRYFRKRALPKPEMPAVWRRS